MWARLRCHHLHQQRHKIKLITEFTVQAVSSSQAKAKKLEIPKPLGGEKAGPGRTPPWLWWQAARVAAQSLALSGGRRGHGREAEQSW